MGKPTGGGIRVAGCGEIRATRLLGTCTGTDSAAPVRARARRFTPAALFLCTRKSDKWREAGDGNRDAPLLVDPLRVTHSIW
jgi:hypothetical protein